MEYHVSDHVEFKARGRVMTGVITKIWNSTPRRNSRIGRIAALSGHDVSELTKTKVQIVPDDDPNVYWTVGLSAITERLGAATKAQHVSAVNTVHGIKQAKQQRRATRRKNNYIDAVDNELINLRPGDAIEVEFRDTGWQPAMFAGFVAGSGNVRFQRKRHGVIRISAARFVRKATVK